MGTCRAADSDGADLSRVAECHPEANQKGDLIMKNIGAGAAVATMILAGSALLAPPALGDTTTYHGLRETFHSVLPCVGPATITTIFNADVHVSTTPGGGYHETDNTTGSFTAVLDAGGTASGHYMIWSAFNTADFVNGTGTFAWNGHVSAGVGAGTSWHENSQYVGSVDLTGIPKVAFDNFHCS